MVKTFIHTAKFATKNTISTIAAPVMRMPSIQNKHRHVSISAAKSRRGKSQENKKVKFLLNKHFLHFLGGEGGGPDQKCQISHFLFFFQVRRAISDLKKKLGT